MSGSAEVERDPDQFYSRMGLRPKSGIGPIAGNLALALASILGSYVLVTQSLKFASYSEAVSNMRAKLLGTQDLSEGEKPYDEVEIVRVLGSVLPFTEKHMAESRVIFTRFPEDSEVLAEVRYGTRITGRLIVAGSQAVTNCRNIPGFSGDANAICETSSDLVHKR